MNREDRIPASVIATTMCLAVAVAPSACVGPVDGPADIGWSPTVDTLPSGRVVVRSADVPAWSPSEAWSLEQRVCVGSLEGDGPDVFGEIRDLEIGPDGNVFVLDGQASEIRVFDPEGTPVRTFGRAGEGPGELNRPAGMAFGPRGLLWVMNWSNARYTAFDPTTGELAEERRRLAGFTAFPWPGGFDREGRLLDMGNAAGTGEAALLRLDTLFVPQDTLPMPTADERHRVAFRQNGQTFMTMPVPFAPQPSWAPHPDGGIIVGEGEAFRLHRLGDRGDTTLTIELERAPTPVTGTERDSALAAFRERAEAIGEGLEPDRDPDVPDTKPAHGSLFVDDVGRVWVRRAAEEGAAWDVFEADGRYLGPLAVSIRPGYGLPAFRGRRLALSTEVDGIPRFCLFDLIEGS